MSSFVVGYALQEGLQGETGRSIAGAVKETFPIWVRALPNLWIGTADANLAEIEAALAPILGPEDDLYLLAIAGPERGMSRARRAAHI